MITTPTRNASYSSNLTSSSDAVSSQIGADCVDSFTLLGSSLFTPCRHAFRRTIVCSSFDFTVAFTSSFFENSHCMALHSIANGAFG